MPLSLHQEEEVFNLHFKGRTLTGASTHDPLPITHNPITPSQFSLASELPLLGLLT